VLTLITGAVGFVLTIPGGREFLRMMLVELISQFFFKGDSDPEYRRLFLELSQKLLTATTEEEKRAILQAIQALRPAR
jgi:hypothetical protein